MRRRQFRTSLILLAVVLVVAACGQADPSLAPGGASFVSSAAIATPKATPNRDAPFPADATPAGTPVTGQPSADWISLPADFTVRTAEQAEALAIMAAHDILAAPRPQVASTWLLTQREADQGNGSVGGPYEDPLALVWWVNLDNDRYVIPTCPDLRSNGTPVGCGSAAFAAIQIVASNGAQPGLTVGRNFTPVAESDGITSPPADAKLRTEGEAIAAALQMVPGADGHVPHVINLRLLGVQQWMQEEAERGAIPNLGLASDTPLWEVELSNAAYPVPCLRIDTSHCAPEHALFLFNALNGESSGIFGPPPAPAATP